MSQYKEQGNAKYKAGKYQEAVDAYGKAIAAEPTEATFYGNRAAALLMLKNFDEALDDCRRAIELDPTFVKGYVRGAKCQSQRGLIREARAILASCLQIDSSCQEVIKEIDLLDQIEKDLVQAQEFLNKSDYDRAGYHVDRLVAQCPDYPSLYTMRADLLIGRKKYDDAASICWALLAKDRQNPDLLFLRGKALLYGGSTEQALKHYQEALRVDPDHSRAREGLKTLKAVEADAPVKAVEAIVGAVEAMERAKTGGNVAFKDGKCAEAIQLYTEALSYDPQNCIYNSTIYCNRAAAKMLQRNYKEAVIPVPLQCDIFSCFAVLAVGAA